MLATREFMAILNRTKHHYQMFFFAQNEDDEEFLIDFFGSRASSKSSTETWVCAMRFMQSSPNQFIGIHFILAIFWFEYTFVQCFSQNMCTLFAHIIYTRLRLFIAMCVYFRNAYIICAHWIDQSNGPAIASVSVCWIFRCWLFADLNIRSHHSQLTFSPSLSHLSVRSCASISFILILCAFLFNDDYSLDISAMCIYSSSSSLLFAVVVVYKFVVLSSLLFRLNCMRVFAAQMWMHFYISNWAYQPTDRKKKNEHIMNTT